MGASSKTRRRESAGSLNAYEGYLMNDNGSERKAEDAEGLHENCQEIMLPLWHLIKGFFNILSITDPLLRGTMQVA